MKNESDIASVRKPHRPRKRVLASKAISEFDQPVGGHFAGLNSNFFTAPARPRGGAPFGNKNALRHGRHTRQMRAFRAEVRAHIRESRTLTTTLKRLLREAIGDIHAVLDDRRIS
jgi:hypothetical protein